MVRKTFKSSNENLNKAKTFEVGMNRGVCKSKVSNKGVIKELKEAQKDPAFIKDISKFIKASTKIYKLN